MDRIENDMYGTKCSFTETHKNFQIHLSIGGMKFLKFIVAYLYCTKYNEIKYFYSVVQKHVSYTGSHKRFPRYYRLYLEMAGYVF